VSIRIGEIYVFTAVTVSLCILKDGRLGGTSASSSSGSTDVGKLPLNYTAQHSRNNKDSHFS
jgi:hypothetical protein